MQTALILAGGLGTRLRATVSDRPKVLAPVAGRPFLRYLLDQLCDQGCHRVILCTGYRGEQVDAAFGNCCRTARLEYSHEPAPLGTGGALRQALPLIDSDPVLVLNGDSYCAFALAPFVAWHHERGSAASLWLTQVADVGRFGSVRVDDRGAVECFQEKTPIAPSVPVPRRVFSPGGAQVNSQGRKPLESRPKTPNSAPEGRQVAWATSGSCRPSGAENPREARRVQGLAPLAINLRPSGAEDTITSGTAMHGDWINAGVYLLSRQFLSSIPEGCAMSLEREVFPAWIGRGLYGYRATVPFLDIGTPASYASAATFLAQARRAG